MTPREPEPVVLDASAVLGWRDEEPGSEIVDRVLDHAVVSAVTLGEVQYKVAEFGDDPDAFAEDLQALGVTILPFTAAHARLLPDLKRIDAATRQRLARAGTHPERPRKLSLGDLCCLATALDLGARVITGDRYWIALGLPIRVTDYRAA